MYGDTAIKTFFTVAATLETDIYHSKRCINLALQTLVPVLNSPVVFKPFILDCLPWQPWQSELYMGERNKCKANVFFFLKLGRLS